VPLLHTAIVLLPLISARPLADTVTTCVTAHAPVRPKEMVTVPAALPCTSPVGNTAAIVASLLLQIPVVVASAKNVLLPVQTENVPVIGDVTVMVVATVLVPRV